MPLTLGFVVELLRSFLPRKSLKNLENHTEWIAEQTAYGDLELLFGRVFSRQWKPAASKLSRDSANA